jgi:hypothetical protein
VHRRPREKFRCRSALYRQYARVDQFVEGRREQLKRGCALASRMGRVGCLCQIARDRECRSKEAGFCPGEPQIARTDRPKPSSCPRRGAAVRRRARRRSHRPTLPGQRRRPRSASLGDQKNAGTPHWVTLRRAGSRRAIRPHRGHRRAPSRFPRRAKPGADHRGDSWCAAGVGYRRSPNIPPGGPQMPVRGQRTHCESRKQGTGLALPHADWPKLNADTWPDRTSGLRDGVLPGSLTRTAHHNEVAVAQQLANGAATAAWP